MDQKKKDWDLQTRAARGELAAVERLLAEGADPMAFDGHGRTALMWACYNNHPEVAALLAPKSDAKEKNSVGGTALMISAGQGNAECLRIVLPLSDPNAISERGKNALMCVMEEADNVSLLNMLLPVSDLSVWTPDGESTLHLAAQYGRTGCVERLLPYFDANEPTKTPRRETALHLAVCADSPACVKILAPASDMRIQDAEGLNAAQRAVDMLQWAALEHLLDSLPIGDYERAIVEARRSSGGALAALMEARLLAKAVEAGNQGEGGRSGAAGSVGDTVDSTGSSAPRRAPKAL